jgi:hypothetical protein
LSFDEILFFHLLFPLLLFFLLLRHLFKLEVDQEVFSKDRLGVPKGFFDFVLYLFRSGTHQEALSEHVILVPEVVKKNSHRCRRDSVALKTMSIKKADDLDPTINDGEKAVLVLYEIIVIDFMLGISFLAKLFPNNLLALILIASLQANKLLCVPVKYLHILLVKVVPDVIGEQDALVVEKDCLHLSFPLLSTDAVNPSYSKDIGVLPSHLLLLVQLLLTFVFHSVGIEKIQCCLLMVNHLGLVQACHHELHLPIISLYSLIFLLDTTRFSSYRKQIFMTLPNHVFD